VISDTYGTLQNSPEIISLKPHFVQDWSIVFFFVEDFMKILIIAIMCLSMNDLRAQVETQVLNSETINVDGYVKEKPATDGELESLHTEIQKQKEETVLNNQKAKSYQELSKSVEKLSETTEEYLLEKKAAQAEIANYNMKVKCLNAETPGPECDKFIRRR
jgi:uncharacterized protein YdbL (DUF1318 family)